MTLSSPLFLVIALVPLLASLLLGTQIRVEYLSELIRNPRPLLVGLAGQYLLLPVLAFVFYRIYPAPADVAWVWFILAAAPGGAISNMVTFLGRGRLSLSVVLTACSTLTAMITLPLWIGVGMALATDGASGSLPVATTVLSSFAILVVPLAAGVTIAMLRPALAERVGRWARPAILGMLLVGMSAYVAQRWGAIADGFQPWIVAGAALFHVSAVAGAWMLASIASLDRRDRFTVSIEVGIQNVVIGVLVVELLGRRDLLPFVSYYAVAMFGLVALWVGVLGGGRRGVPGGGRRGVPAGGRAGPTDVQSALE